MRRISKKGKRKEVRENFSLAFPLLAKVENLLLIVDSQEKLSPEERFLLTYLRLATRYRLAILEKEQIKLNFLSQAIDLEEKLGEKLGFSKDDLCQINVFVRERFETKNKLTSLINSISLRLKKLREENC